MAGKSQNNTISVLAKPTDFYNAFVASNFNNTSRLRRGLATNFKNITNNDHGKNSLLKFQITIFRQANFQRPALSSRIT